jgi:hypothetical protein
MARAIGTSDGLSYGLIAQCSHQRLDGAGIPELPQRLRRRLTHMPILVSKCRH